MKKTKKQTTSSNIKPQVKDTSPRVFQREKIDYTLNLRPYDKYAKYYDPKLANFSGSDASSMMMSMLKSSSYPDFDKYHQILQPLDLVFHCYSGYCHSIRLYTQCLI